MQQLMVPALAILLASQAVPPPPSPLEAAPVSDPALVKVEATPAPVTLDSEARVKEICLALRPSERMTFAGGPGAQVVARGEFERHRDALRKSEFFIELPWSAFKVAEWDPAEHEVRISTERPFRAFKGALTFFDADRDVIELDSLESSEDELKAGLAKGQLTLAMVFRPSEDEASPCTASKAPSYTFSVDLVSAELRLNGKPLARAQNDGFVPLPSSDGHPTVEIRSAMGEDENHAVVASVALMKPAIEKCYAEALSRKPSLDGSLILGVEVGKDGKMAADAVIADSVNDAEVTGCVKVAVAGARPAKGESRGTVAIHLERR